MMCAWQSSAAIDNLRARLPDSSAGSATKQEKAGCDSGGGDLHIRHLQHEAASHDRDKP